LNQTLQKTNEAAKIPFIAVKRVEAPRILPVPETESVAEWIPTKHDDESVEQEADDKQHFTQSHPELGLSIPLNRK
jgi:hypothetical protein